MAASRIFSGTAHKERDGNEPSPPSGSPRVAAIRLLSRRDYSTRELRKRLIDRGYDAASVDEALTNLQESGLLDDRRVAAAHARVAVTVKGRGRWRVARELESRGIARELADQALSGLDADAETSALKKILTRKRFPAKPTGAERRRMVQHLLRRGFAADAIYKALGRGRGEPEDPTDD